MILWKNLYVSNCNRSLRTLLVSIITLLLLAVSLIGIVVCKYY